MLIGIREIEEKYEVLAKMGEGGMGAIYKARHKLLDEIRVIKTIKPDFQEDQDLQNRFVREAQVAAKLRHSNIATIHDFAFSEDGTAFIVMDFIAGQNLRDYQRGGGNLTVAQVADVARQSLDALGYLHEKSFVHRDISTDNMMISWPEGRLHITLIDLGLAKSLEGSQWKTKTGMVVGKVRYISPEQLNSGFAGTEVDARSDLYSFGVVLYELLTGEFPITGEDDMSLIAGHLYRPPRPFDETDPREAIQAPLRSVVMRALEKSPELRWPTAAAFSEALNQALSSGVTQEVVPTGLPVAPQTLTTTTVDPDMPTATVDVNAIAATQPVGPTPATYRTMPATPAGQPQPVRQAVQVDTEAVTAPITQPLPTTSDPEHSAQPSIAAPTRPASWHKPAAAVAALFLLAAAAWFFDLPSRFGGAGDGAEGEPIYYGEYHALLIGNDEYQRLPNLETAVRDVQALGQLLSSKYGFRVTELKNATRQQMTEKLGELASQLTPRDNLLVYYAGHGQILNMSPYWQAVDAESERTENWISTRHEVADMLDRAFARHILVVADSCYAGATLEAPPSPLETLVEKTDDTELRRLSQRRSRMVLTSGGFKPVLDTGGGGHSVFARAMLEALRGNDQTMQASQLFETVQRQVTSAAARMGFEQTPVFVAMPGMNDEGGELFFVPVAD